MPRASRSQSSTVTGPRLMRRTSRIAAPPPVSVPHEEIALRAYELFEHDGRAHGHDLDHWLEAERQLVQTRAQANPARRVAGKAAN